MKINICICNSIKELINAIVLCDENCFPLLSDSRTTCYIDILKKQGFEINYYDYITDVKDYILDDIQYSLMQPNKNSVVVALGSDEYRWLAYYHARLTNSNLKFCSDEEGLLDWLENQECQYVTVLGRQQDIKVSLISRVYNVQEKVFNKFRFYPGFLTGRDVNEVLWLILKNYLYSKIKICNSITFDRLEYNDEIRVSGLNEVYPNASSTCDFVNDLIINKANGLLTMIGHGRDDVYWLNDGAICGKCIIDEEGNKDNVINANYPACYYTNSCFKRGTPIVLAKDIACRHVFMNSCYSNKIEQGLFPDEYNLVYAFVGGHSASYLGTSFMVDGQSTMNYYYVAQLMSGISLGVAAYNVSKFYLNYKLGHDMAFFLIGEPSSYLIDGTSTLLFDCDLSSEREYDVNTEQYLIIIRLPGSSLMDDLINYRKKMELFFSNNSNCFFVLRNDDSWTYLDIFSKGKMNPGTITIKIQDFPLLDLGVIRFFEAILAIGIYPSSKFKTSMIEARDMSMKIAKDRKYQAYNTKNIFNMYKRLERYKDKILYLSQTVVDYLLIQCHNKGFTWDDQCLANGLNFSHYLKSDVEVCENCGRELYIMNYHHDYFGELKRDYYCCSACGIVKDFPSGYDDIEVNILGEDKVIQAQRTQQTVVIKNNSKLFICGSVGMSIASGKEENISYDNDMKSTLFELYPNDFFEYTVNISISENTVPHNHWIYIYAIINGKIWSIKKDLWVIVSEGD